MGRGCIWRILGGGGVIDGMADKYISNSPYHFVANNPILFFDIDGNEFTQSALVRVQELANEIDKGVASNNSKIAEVKKDLASGDISSKKAAKQIAKAEKSNNALEANRTELAQMAASDQVYNVQENPTSARLFSSYGAALVARAAVNYVAKHVFEGLYVKLKMARPEIILFSFREKPSRESGDL